MFVLQMQTNKSSKSSHCENAALHCNRNRLDFKTETNTNRRKKKHTNEPATICRALINNTFYQIKLTENRVTEMTERARARPRERERKH